MLYMLYTLHMHHITLAYDIMRGRPDSSKGGAVETGCTDLHYVIH